MKLVRKGDHLVFHLGGRERVLLPALLDLYPCIPSSHSLKESKTPESSRKLLDEALREQRSENQKRLRAFLNDPKRFKQTTMGWEFTVSAQEVEWLLQVLNDIRVGSWIGLGSPEVEHIKSTLDENTAPHFWAMESAGHFQMQILDALNS